jgi:transketolase
MPGDNELDRLRAIARQLRRNIVKVTRAAGSGHPSSAASAVELMTVLFFGGVLRYDVSRPDHPNNDRLIFSKGHASPLFYALWAAAGALKEEDLGTYRRLDSVLEGHPRPNFPFCEAATGSLGQGLAIGVGMALNAKYLDDLPYRTYVLLGDGEMSEGSQWESIQIAAHYELGNLIGVLDVNRLGQTGETMIGHDLEVYQKRLNAFGWRTITVDGHAIDEIRSAYEEATADASAPVMIIARTLKGKGLPGIEDREGWHGKVLPEAEAASALAQLAPRDGSSAPVPSAILLPEDRKPRSRPAGSASRPASYASGAMVATRKAFGSALRRLGSQDPRIVVLDADVGNSTYADVFREAYPDRFYQTYIAEQNMVGMALGLSRRGKIPVVATFAAFLTRAFDQIRMSQYSQANIKFVGSHGGVYIGQDGPSQMGLEDVAMFRTIRDGVVLCPCDAASTEQLLERALQHEGIVYLRTTREAVPVVYDSLDAGLRIGGSSVLRTSTEDRLTIVAAGTTVHEALAAYEQLRRGGVFVRVVDAYSIKPLDVSTLRKAARETGAVLTVEDHYAEGGLGEAVSAALAADAIPVRRLAVERIPGSGQPAELLRQAGIDRETIVSRARNIARSVAAESPAS